MQSSDIHKQIKYTQFPWSFVSKLRKAGVISGSIETLSGYQLSQVA
jgi:hypothetical protein